MKLFPIFALLSLFASQALAYDVGIKVTVTQDTLAVGTNVTIVKDGVLLYTAKAGADGIAPFKLDAGSYFVYLDRGGYSRHVNLLEVTKTENVTYTMRQLISSASAYGQITGPSDFSGSSVAAYLDGKIVKRVSPNADGYYVLPFVPDGTYSLVFSAPGFVDRSAVASLVASQFSEVNVELGKEAEPLAEPPVMTAPAAAKEQSAIWIALARGGVPLPGETVAVKTPSGSMEVVTGADGKAWVNAAQPGTYVFTYGNLSATTVVEGGENPAPAQPPAVDDEPSAPSLPGQQASGGGLAAGALALAMLGAMAVLGVIIFVMGRMVRKGKHDAWAKRPGQEALAPPAEQEAHKKGHAHKKK
ncbi:MAG: carboxypeptidase-like regulatory domain-containing protein [Candidatus Micrarchaeia archaeon]